MYCVVIALCILCATMDAKVTYGELAKDLGTLFYDNMKTALPSLNDTSLPTTVKAVRKAVLYLRDSLDIFVYSYPDVDQKEYSRLYFFFFLLPFYSNTWGIIRVLLDEGYTFIGEFQDLQYSHPTPKEQAKLLQKCLDVRLFFFQFSLKLTF